MGEQDDVEERFRRLVAEMEPGSSPPLPKASRASMREVKREARQRKKAAARPPQPPAPHRAYLEAVSDLPGRGARRRTRRPRPARLHSERVRTISIGVAVLAIMASVIYFQWFRAATSTAVADPTVPSSDSAPTPGVGEANEPLGSPPVVEDQPGRYSFVATQAGSTAPVAYDPCRPIHYVVRTANAPRQASSLLSSAFATLSAATGMTFVDDGPTTEIPTGQREPYQPSRYGDRWAPVLLGWATPQENPGLADDVIGLAGSASRSVPGGPRVFVSGEAAFDVAWFRRSLTTAGGRAEAEAVVLHELGHVLGLGHVADASQVMFAMERPKVTTYGVGDLAGLARLGGGACEPRL